MTASWIVVIALGLTNHGTAEAEKKLIPPEVQPRCKPLAFRSGYSPLHYWAPRLYRTRALIHDGREYIYPPGYQEKRFTLKKGENCSKKKASQKTAIEEVKPEGR